MLVVGDVMLDRYWFGDVERISPEARVVLAEVVIAEVVLRAEAARRAWCPCDSR